MLKKLLRVFSLGAALALGALAVPALAASISLFTGPAGSNPIKFPAALGDMNTLIQTLNSNIFSYLTLNNSSSETGELALSASNAFLANGTGTVTISNVQPAGYTATIGEWLVIIDNNGNYGIIPVWKHS